MIMRVGYIWANAMNVVRTSSSQQNKHILKKKNVNNLRIIARKNAYSFDLFDKHFLTRCIIHSSCVLIIIIIIAVACRLPIYSTE